MANAVDPITSPQTILRKVQTRGGTCHIEGHVAATKTIYPGMLVERVTGSNLPDGEWQPHSTAGGNAEAIVAKEIGTIADVPYATYAGGGITVPYNAGDFFHAHLCQPGDEIYLRVAAAATAILITDFLESAGNGTVRKATSTNTRLFKALEALDNSAGASAAYIHGRKL